MMTSNFGEWKDDKGNVFVSKMNIKLMAKMFAGNIAAVMGDKVAKEEENILKGLLID